MHRIRPGGHVGRVHLVALDWGDPFALRSARAGHLRSAIPLQIHRAVPTSAGHHERNAQIQYARGAGGRVLGPRRRLFHCELVDQQCFGGSVASYGDTLRFCSDCGGTPDRHFLGSSRRCTSRGTDPLRNVHMTGLVLMEPAKYLVE